MARVRLREFLIFSTGNSSNLLPSSSDHRAPGRGDAEPAAGGDPARPGEVPAPHAEGDLRAAGGAPQHHEGKGQEGQRGIGET